MTVVLLTLLTGIVLLGVVIVARLVEADSWRKSLKAYLLTLPTGLKLEDVASWLGRIAASTHATSRFALLPLPPVVFTVIATNAGIRHELRIPESLDSAVLAGLRAALPGVRIDALPAKHIPGIRPLVAAEARLSGERRPLAVDRAEATSAHVLASLSPIGPREEIRLEWIITGAGTPAPIRSNLPASGTLQDLLGTERSVDGDELRAARLKQRDPLLHAVVRLGIVARSRPAAYRLFGRVWGALRGMNAPGAMVVRSLVPSFMVSRRMEHRALPVLRWPMLLGSTELAGLLGVPLGGMHLPGLTRGTARQLPPAMSLPRSGAVIGESNYAGMSGRPLALKTADRLKHLWAIGPTGTGKSTLLCNLIAQDMAAGRGLAVLDYKGDLVKDVLDRVPESRRDDVVLLDPSVTDQPIIGVNVLDLAGGEAARELAVDQLVHIMASLWRSSFGPRTTDVLRNSLLTLTHTRAADGSAHTLVELPELLLNARYRHFVTRQPGVPPSVRPFWTAYEQMSDNERAQVIGPSMNKIRSFTTRSSLRLMLGQSTAFQLSEVFVHRRILLVPLSAGVLGGPTTQLLGALLMASLWSAIQARVNVTAERRHPVFVYLDEFQHFLKLDLELSDMLAAARGYGVGYVLSHQFLSQLTPEVKAAVLGTVRNAVTFSLELDDARALAPRFAPLTADDLTGQHAYEIALKASVNNTTLPPATGRTLPLGAATTDGAALAVSSRARYGMARDEVEAALAARTAVGGRQHGTFGWEARSGEQA